jgi:hypothetical protein
MNETNSTLLRGVYAVVAAALVIGLALGAVSFQGFVGGTGQVPSILAIFGYGHIAGIAFPASLTLIVGSLALALAANEFLEPE